MKSPFPGMDPYIEASGLWGDFHDDLIGEIKRTLAASLPKPYVVRTSARSYVQLVEAEGKEIRLFLPDVHVVTPRPGTLPATAGQLAVAEPETESETVSLRAFVTEQFRESFVEVYYQSDKLQLVTSIEVLSPSNKLKGSEGWTRYMRKRQTHLVGEANLIELDLLRGGDRFPMLDPWPQSPYTLLICRRIHAPRCRVTKAHFLRPLPVLPIPLAYPDPDGSLALQPMIEAIYQRGQYDITIDYNQPCEPPLSADEAAWLQKRLKVRSTTAESPPLPG